MLDLLVQGDKEGRTEVVVTDVVAVVATDVVAVVAVEVVLVLARVVEELPAHKSDLAPTQGAVSTTGRTP